MHQKRHFKIFTKLMHVDPSLFGRFITALHFIFACKHRSLLRELLASPDGSTYRRPEQRTSRFHRQ